MKNTNQVIDQDKIVFCTLTYQENYDGQEAGESSNFMDYNHRCYGHVKNGGDELHLESQVQGVDEKTQELSGYTVVWVGADEQEDSRIIGWYENATIYRYKQELDNSAFDGRVFSYFFSAEAKDCYLLKPADRDCVLQGAAQELRPIAAKYIENCRKTKTFDQVAFSQEDLYGTLTQEERMQAVATAEQLQPAELAERFLAIAKDPAVTNDWKRALRLVNTAIELDKNEENLMMRSQYFFQFMCYLDAAKDYEELVRISDRLDYKCGLFNLCIITKQNELAVSCGEKAFAQELVENSNMKVTTGINLSVLYVEMKEFQKALEILEKLKTFELTDYEKIIVVSMKNDVECTLANLV